MELCTGEEALQEVAKPDGRWNWCILGPDPQQLPLVAGGSSSVEDIQDAIGAHPTVYGLVRMSFGAGGDAVHQWVRLLASDKAENEAKQVSPVAQGKAAGKAPQMEAAFGKFSSASVSVTVRNKEECTAERLIEALVKGDAPDKDKITLEAHKEAVQELMTKSGGKERKRRESVAQDVAHLLEANRHGAQGAPPPDLVPETPGAQEGEESKGGEVELFKETDVVTVWSNTSKSWHDDGVVAAVIVKAQEVDGHPMPAGSFQVWFNKGESLKWMFPCHIGMYVKRSTRPKPPPMFKGMLKKETHNLVTTWNARWCVLSAGLLQWWMSEDDYNNRKAANGSIALYHLNTRFSKKSFSTFRISTAATKGVIYSFDAESDKLAEEWVNLLQRHGDFCTEYSQFFGTAADLSPKSAK